MQKLLTNGSQSHLKLQAIVKKELFLKTLNANIFQSIPGQTS